MISGACDVDFECEPTEPEEFFAGINGCVNKLKNLYTSKLLDEDSLIGLLNFEVYKELEICGFCKGEIKDSEHETNVILHTTEKLAIEKIKDMLMDPECIIIETKPYVHPYDQDVTERYKITFSYWDIADELKQIEWENLKEAIDYTKEMIE